MKRCAFVLLLLSFVPAGTLGQSFFEHFTRADGLPGSQVLALHEDAIGYIWIGTESGLARYEGVRMRCWWHDRKDVHSIPNNVIWDITSDERGRVWIATDHGLGRYDANTGAFDRFFVTDAYNDPTSANRIHRVVSDGHGLLWLSTEDGIHVFRNEDRPTGIDLPGNAAPFNDLRQRTDRHVITYDKQRDGLWINTATSIHFYQAGQQAFLTAPHPPPFTCLGDTRVQNVTPDGNGGIWYFTATTNELVHEDAQGTVRSRDILSTTKEGIVNPQFIGLDRTGAVWLSTWSHELRRRDASTGQWLHFTHDAAIPWSMVSTNTKSWLQDRAGRIWLGTFEGLELIAPSHDRMRLSMVASINDPVHIAVVRDMDASSLLIGTSKGLVVHDRVSGTNQELRSNEPDVSAAFLPHLNAIRCLGRYGTGWLVGTQHGLLHVDDALHLQRPGSIVEQEPRLKEGFISFITTDQRGDTWIGKRSGGLFRIDAAGRVAPFDSVARRPLGSRQLLSAATGPDGMWFGLNNGRGLAHVRDGEVVERALNTADSTGANYGVVPSLAVNDAGTLYVGTLMGGLGVRQHGDTTLSWYTRSDGLPSDRIEQLLLDGNGGLWIRTNDGICRFDVVSHAIHRLEVPRTVQALGEASAMWIGADGSLLCAFGPVLLSMPAQQSLTIKGPRIVLTGLRYGGQDHASWVGDSTVVLEHDQRALSIEYGVIGGEHDNTLRFAYRVLDDDTTWRSLGTSARLDLNDLPVGEHRVEVRANAGGSTWTEHPLALHVRVLPPVWGTWWFRIGVALLLVLIAWAGVRYYVQERLAEQRAAHERQQAVLGERMRIAGDMHDDLGAGLSALKLRSEMALRVEKDPTKREQLGTLARTAGDLLGSMRQIIWTMNADQSTLEDLVVYTTSYARNYCAENDLPLTVLADPPWPVADLSSEQRRNVFLVVKEALHNVVKHAHAKHVRLALSWNGTLEVVLQDDGVGVMTGADAGMGNGMRNMRKRIEQLGGTFSIDGSSGTRLHFVVPLVTNEGSIGPHERS